MSLFRMWWWWGWGGPLCSLFTIASLSISLVLSFISKLAAESCGSAGAPELCSCLIHVLMQPSVSAKCTSAVRVMRFCCVFCSGVYGSVRFPNSLNFLRWGMCTGVALVHRFWSAAFTQVTARGQKVSKYCGSAPQCVLWTVRIFE